MRPCVRISRLSMSLLLVFAVLASTWTAVAQDEPNDSSMFQGGAGRTGVQPGPGPDLSAEFVLRWQIDIEEQPSVTYPEARATSGFAVLDGVAYFGAVDGSTRAIEIQTGEEVWLVGGSAPLIGTPAIVDGRIVLVDSTGSLYARSIDDGELLWSAEFGEPIRRIENFNGAPSPAIVDGVVYIGWLDGKVYALDLENGATMWTSQFESGVFSPVAVLDGQVFAVAETLRAIDAATGETNWETENPNNSGYDGIMASPDGFVWLQHFWGVTKYGLDGEVHFDSVGENYSRWKVAPAIHEDYMVFGTGGFIYAVNPNDGSEHWRYDLGGRNFFTSVVSIADGVVWFRYQSNLIALDLESGELLLEFTFNDGTFATDGTSGVVIADGVVLMRKNALQFAAFGAPSDAQMAETAAAVSAEETATAEANMTATAVEDANVTATAEAAVTATARAEVQATEEAFETSWETWAAAVQAGIGGSGNFPASFTLDEADVEFIDEENGPFVFATWSVEISSTASGNLGIGIFDSEEAAAAEYRAIIDGYIRSGYTEVPLDDLGDNAACYTIIDDGVSSADCFVLRGDTILLTNSEIEADALDAALLNASDLMRLLDAAVQAAPRP